MKRNIVITHLISEDVTEILELVPANILAYKKDDELLYTVELSGVSKIEFLHDNVLIELSHDNEIGTSKITLDISYNHFYEIKFQ